MKHSLKQPLKKAWLYVDVGLKRGHTIRLAFTKGVLNIIMLQSIAPSFSTV